MSKNDTLGFYTEFLPKFSEAKIGPKPTAALLDTYAALGARHGKQCLAGAMSMRPDGVTGSEIVIACGAPQLNKMRGFVTDGLLKRVLMPPRNGHTVYKHELTDKGKKRIAGQAQAATPKAEAAKVVTAATVKAKVKRNKAKAAIKAAKAELKAANVESVAAAQPAVTEASPEAPQS